MILDTQIRDQAYQCFAQESLELLQTIETGLLNLPTNRSRSHVHSLMRAAHSIKGGAASLDLDSIKQIAHRLEDIFRALYDETAVVDSALQTDLLSAFDCLRSPLITQVQTGRHDAALALHQSEAIFAKLETQLAEALQTSNELPTAADLGVDIVQMIFTGDVEAGLKRLEQVLSHPEGAEVLGEIRAQADVFIGLGELVNLPGFLAIAQLTLTALDCQPDNAWEIGRTAVADWRAGQHAVLAGDRAHGGHPSPALISFTQPSEFNADFEPELATNVTLELDLDWDVHADLNGDHTQSQAMGDLPSLDEIFESVTLADPYGLDALFAPSPDPSQAALLDQMEVHSLIADPDLELDLDVHPDQPIAAVGVPGEVAGTELAGTELAVTDGALSAADGLTFNAELYLDPAPQSLPRSQSLSSDLPTVTASPVPEPAADLNTPYRVATSNTIRVDRDRLERINNLVGELVTEENRSLLENQQLQDTLKLMLQRFNRFEQITKYLEVWSDRSQQANVQLHGVDLPYQTATFGDFDPLQMDSYTHLQTVVQETMEEIAQLGEAMRDMTLLTQQTQQTLRKKQQTLKQVRTDLLWARMLPLNELLQRFPRMVHDLAMRYQKQVMLKLTGANTLVDKGVLEKLYDPLVHLVRNAFDHGIEAPDLRIAHGKPPQGTIEIRAYYRGNQTYIEVRDDGGGLDLAAIKQRAIALKLVQPETADQLSQDELYEFLFAPAFSTTSQVTELSGRGMGLDMVRSQVAALKGTVTVTSTPGEGTTITLRLPLTLTIAKLLVFAVNHHLMALPIDSLLAILAVPEAAIETLQGRQFYRWDEQLIPLYPPSEFQHIYPLVKAQVEQPRSMPLPQDGKVPLLVVADGDRIVALEVEQILQEQELVIKPFGRAVPCPSYLYGCTILGDGSLVPVIDSPALIDRWLRPNPNAEFSSDTRSPVLPVPLSQTVATILVVDDSLTTRQTLALNLKKAGYRVLQARDGRDALAQLREDASIQAVFCDVEMPQMNGFEFLNHCRQTYSRDELPVIMLTSRSGEKHRRIAELMGATAYLTKPYLEHELLKTLQTYLPNHSPNGASQLDFRGNPVGIYPKTKN